MINGNEIIKRAKHTLIDSSTPSVWEYRPLVASLRKYKFYVHTSLALKMLYTCTNILGTLYIIGKKIS